MKPSRLLIVVNDPAFFLSHRLPVALAARARGLEVHVATPSGASADEIRTTGFKWHPIAITRSGKNPVTEALGVADLARLYRRLRPRLVHHVTPKAVLYGSVAARLTRVPAVVNAITGLGYAFSDETSQNVTRRAVEIGFRLALDLPRTVTIFQNEEDRQVFVAARIVKLGETELIPGSGVDVRAFRPRTQPVNSASDAPTVLLGSRLLRAKGILQFCEAAERLYGRGVAANFVVAGEPDPGNPDTITSDELQRLRSRGRVRFLGRVKDMASLFASSDIACLPTFYREGVPKFLIEAGAAGLPSVTTDIAGCRELVRHGITGLIVPPRDVDALSDALVRLVQSAELRDQMGAAARDHVVQSYGVDSVVERTLAVYARLGVG